MCRKIYIQSVFVIALLFTCYNITIGQENYDDRSKMLDLKLKLLDSKIELLDSKMKVWEAKPEELDLVLYEMEGKIAALDFDPGYFNYKFYQLDSLIKIANYSVEKQNNRKFKKIKYDTLFIKPLKSAISLNPVRLYEGSFQISYERIISKKLSVDLSGIATYATNDGLSNTYMTNQKLEYYNDLVSSYVPLNARNISGYGGSLELKNYLLSGIHPKQNTPIGLYAGPQIIYRRAIISGMDNIYYEDEEEWREVEITRKLNIISAGVIIGYKVPLLKVLCIDGYLGGMIRLAKYDDEDEFTKYKKLGNIDYSGVLPTAGIKIGVLK